MHCKVALVFLLGLTMINASVIARFNYPTYHSQALRDLRLPLGVEEPSRHLLPPFEDYGGARLYSNGIFRSVQPDWQLANERQENDEQFKPKIQSYDVVNRVLPEVQEPTDFQPLEQQITQVADNVKNTQQTVNDFDNYLQGVAAVLAPQNKPKNGVLRITMALTPMLGEVPTSSLAEKDFADSISSILVEDSTDSESAKRDKELETFLSSLFGEDSTESHSAKKGQEFVHILQNRNLISFDDDNIEEDSAKSEEEFEDLLSSMIGENNDSAKQEQEFVNILQKIIEEDMAKHKKRIENLSSFDEDILDREEKERENLLSSMIEEDIAKNKKEWEDSAKKQKEFENLLSSILREDNTASNSAKDLSQKADKRNDDEEEFDEHLDSYLNKIFAAEAREEEEEKDEEIEKTAADSDDKDLEELDSADYLNSLFASVNDDYFIR